MTPSWLPLVSEALYCPSATQELVEGQARSPNWTPVIASAGFGVLTAVHAPADNVSIRPPTATHEPPSGHAIALSANGCASSVGVHVPSDQLSMRPRSLPF